MSKKAIVFAAGMIAVVATVTASPPAFALTNQVTTDMRNRTGHDMTLNCSSPHEHFTIGPHSSTNITGHAGAFSSADDISCAVTVDGGSSGKTHFHLSVKNPHVGYPSVTVGHHTDTFEEGAHWTVISNFVHVDVSRWADNPHNDEKLFTFTFTTSRDRS